MSDAVATVEEERADIIKAIVPGALRKPKTTLDGSMLWFYGPPKIGKTTLSNNFPGAWFIATEKGQDFIECREPTVITCWGDFLTLGTAIIDQKITHFGDGEPIQTIVIDTIDRLFKMCNDEICHGLGVEDLGEMSHGKGWGRLTAEFETVMNKVRNWPWTLICISHARQKEFKTKAIKVDRWEPSIGAAGYRWCQAMSDLIGYAYTKEIAEFNADGEVTGEITTERRLLCHPQAWAVAGGRMAQYYPSSVLLGYDELQEPLRSINN